MNCVGYMASTISVLFCDVEGGYLGVHLIMTVIAPLNIYPIVHTPKKIFKKTFQDSEK